MRIEVYYSLCLGHDNLGSLIHFWRLLTRFRFLQVRYLYNKTSIMINIEYTVLGLVN